MNPPPHAVRKWRVVEAVLLTLVIASFIDTVHLVVDVGWFPEPFNFDFNDTFMDWFNTAYWAHHRGVFDVWQTVYPPLSFVFLQIFGVASCYTRDPFYARQCDTFGIGAILGFYALSSFLALLAFRRADRATGLMRGIAFVVSLPMVFLLERGNLIIPCLAAFILAHGDLTRSRWVRAAAAGLTINFKPYLVMPVFAWAFKRQWRRLELAAIATLALFCVTYAILGDGSPMQLLRNTLFWSQAAKGYVWEQIYYTSSYGPFVEFDTARFPTRDFVPSTYFEPFVAAIPIVIHSSQALAALCLAGAWLQPEALPTRRLSLLLLAVSLITSSPGGYTQTFLIFLLFLEKWERPGPIVALIAGYLLCISYDWNLGNFFTLTGDSWLVNHPVTASFGMRAGMFARPGLVLILFWGVALDSLWLVWRAHGSARPLLGLMRPSPRAVAGGAA